MSKNTSILLGSHFDNFISNEIASGKYNSASEVIRNALRLLEHESEKLKAIREALLVGENSGYVENFNPKEHLKMLKSKLK